ncbi:MAG: MarR family transcriptional regulator [Chloroflexi bacterium]|nr:MarR family transcriptional regulator [Chloroflexota bacterium]
MTTVNSNIDALIESILDNYGRAAGVFDPNRLEVWEELGLTMSQLRVLYMLQAGPGTPAGAVAAQLKVRPSTATGIVDRLVRDGLVRRERDDLDRRRVRIWLTERGMRVINELRARNRAQIWKIFRNFSQQQLDDIDRTFTLLTAEAERQGVLAPWPMDPEVM